MLIAGTTAFGKTSGQLSETIHDPQGAAVPGATVKAINASTNQEIESISSGEGTFAFRTLAPGNYTVTVELTGFKKPVKTGIIIGVAEKQTTGVLVLEVGGITDTVSVSADAALLQVSTTSGEMAAGVDQVTASELSPTKLMRSLAISARVCSYSTSRRVSITLSATRRRNASQARSRRPQNAPGVRGGNASAGKTLPGAVPRRSRLHRHCANPQAPSS